MADTNLIVVRTHNKSDLAREIARRKFNKKDLKNDPTVDVEIKWVIRSCPIDQEECRTPELIATPLHLPGSCDRFR